MNHFQSTDLSAATRSGFPIKEAAPLARFTVRQHGETEAPSVLFLTILGENSTWLTQLSDRLIRDYHVVTIHSEAVAADGDACSLPGGVGSILSVDDLAGIVQDVGVDRLHMIACPMSGGLIGEYLQNYGGDGVGSISFLSDFNALDDVLPKVEQPGGQDRIDDEVVVEDHLSLEPDIVRDRIFAAVQSTIASMESTASHFDPRIARTIKLMETKFHKDVPLADLAETAGMSIFAFTRAFKREVGVTPHHFLMRLRVEHAKAYLRSTTLAIAEIAYRVGWTNISHFTSVFRRLTGRTPGSFRQSMAA
jgi:AraC-like DNA-binding protein